MKEKIKTNLENLFNQYYNPIKDLSYQSLVDTIIESNNEWFDITSGLKGSLYDDDEIAELKKSKKSKRICGLFEAAIKGLQADEQTIVERLKKDIQQSLGLLRKKVQSENKGLKNQIIFLEHDYEPWAYLCGFGEGNYPILDAPAYVKYNGDAELYNGYGKIDYSPLWKDIQKFDALLEDKDMTEMICHSPLYEALKKAYQFKINLLLFGAFDQLPITVFDGIPTALPLYIFANEHDCEAMNIYLYE